VCAGGGTSGLNPDDLHPTVAELNLDAEEGLGSLAGRAVASRAGARAP
jgi:hypothetical protein